ncbi:MAG: family 16 glycoside hydrolase, partial [Vicinamibacterales bacterium]
MSAKPLVIAIGAIGAAALLAGSAVSTQGGFTPLFNGKDLSGWKVPAGDNGHWKVLDGVIDYDAESEAPGDDKALWSEREYGNFT